MIQNMIVNFAATFSNICVGDIRAASSESGTYITAMRAAKVRAGLRIHAVSQEPLLLAHTSSESRGTFRQKARSLAPLNGWACAVKICHDGMLEDKNSLDGAHTRESLTLKNTKVQRTVCEPQHDKTYKMTCASNETSDQSGHPSSLITVFAVRSVGSWWPNASSLNSEDWSDRMSRMTWVFAGCMSFGLFCHAAAQL